MSHVNQRANGSNSTLFAARRILFQTYLAVAEWDGLDEQHCLIVPTEHVSSSVQLDENVWDEMRIWRKGKRFFLFGIRFDILLEEYSSLRRRRFDNIASVTYRFRARLAGVAEEWAIQNR